VRKISLSRLLVFVSLFVPSRAKSLKNFCILEVEFVHMLLLMSFAVGFLTFG